MTVHFACAQTQSSIKSIQPEWLITYNYLNPEFKIFQNCNLHSSGNYEQHIVLMFLHVSSILVYIVSINISDYT